MDYAVVIATLLGPILAVQAQKWIERGRERRDKQLQIFHVLMSTRAVRGNSLEHVQALNSISVVFNRKLKKEKSIIDSWNLYFDHLHDLESGASFEENKRWNEKSSGLLVDLLAEMSMFLGYDFDKVQLKKGSYFPRGQLEEQATQAALRNNFADVLQGKQAIKMEVVSLPPANQ